MSISTKEDWEHWCARERRKSEGLTRELRKKLKEQRWGNCYFAVETTPFYIGDDFNGDADFDPSSDPRRSHNCAYPAIVKQRKEANNKNTRIYQIGNDGYPSVIEIANLDIKFGTREPEVCRRCSQYQRHPELASLQS